MGYNVKYQITDKERKALINLLKARNRYLEEGEPVITLDTFAKDALIGAANRLYAIMTTGSQHTQETGEN